MSAFIRYQPVSLGGGGGGSSSITIGTIDSQAAAANGAVASGMTLYLQSADATHPGLVNHTTQTFAGQKTFSTGLTGTLTGSASLNVLTSALGNLTDAGTDGITVTGGTGATVGAVSLSQHVADTTHNGYLSSTDWNTFNNKQAALTIGNLTDAGTDGITITSGTGAVIGSGTSIAQHVADTTHNGYLSSTDWNTFNGKQASGNYITALTGDGTASGPGSVALTLATVNGNVGSFTLSNITVNGKGLVTAASSTAVGNLTAAGTDGIAVTSGTGAVIGSGTSLAQHVADTTHNGYLSSTDWNTFNGKQASGNYITALTGDVTASGPGSSATSLVATTNATLTTLSALVSVGTITTGTWSATTIALNKGGTGQTTKAAAFDALQPMTTGGDIIYGGASGTGTRLANGSAGQFLKSNGTTLAPSWAAPTVSFTAPTIQKFTSVVSAQTYTTPANVLYIRVIMVGGGGGGAGSGTSGAGNGGNGGNTTFGTSLLSAGGGTGATHGQSDGAPGGTSSLGSGPIGTALTGGGGGGSALYVSGVQGSGGQGGSSALGGAGSGAGDGTDAGGAGVANTGGGGGGGGTAGVASAISGSGGGSGGYVDAIITSPAATYTYTVGAAGTAGSAGTSGFVGGAGGTGYIIVYEYYQ